jgi:hypothetical protein
MLIGYHLANDQGGVDWGTFSGTPSTWKLGLIDILKNPRLRAIYFITGGIWLKLPLG